MRGTGHDEGALESCGRGELLLGAQRTGVAGGRDPGLRTPARVSSLTPSGSRMDTRRGLPDIESHRDLHIWIIEVSGTTRQKNW